MTWKEIKDFVESKGVEDDDTVDYIEINWMVEGVIVERKEGTGWIIT